MANTRNDVVIPEGVWVNLFTGSGIPVGTACTVFNKSSATHYVAISLAAPPLPSAEPTKMPKGVINYVSGTGVNVAAGASGLWAYSPQGTSYALVQE